MTPTTRDTRSADEMYRANSAKIQTTIKKLQAGLKAHRKEQKADPLNYGYPGDLSYVLDLLDRAARFICGEEE